MSEKKYAQLPANDAVQNWFEENIDKECSASSAVYKFRQWLESLQGSRQPGAVWVRASARLPEKDGYYCFKANGGYMGAYLRTATNGSRWFCDSAGGTIRNWKKCEWLDESPAEQPGREDNAEAFAKFLDEQRNSHTPDMWAGKAIWSKPTAFQEWLQYFKQQKEVKP